GNLASESAEELGGQIGLSGEALEQIRRDLPALIEERAALLGLDSVTSRELFQGAISDANAELASLNARVSHSNRLLLEHKRLLDSILTLHSGIAGLGVEDVCRGVAEAVSGLLPELPIAVLVLERGRGLVLLAGARPAAGLTVTPLP